MIWLSLIWNGQLSLVQQETHYEIAASVPNMIMFHKAEHGKAQGLLPNAFHAFYCNVNGQ